MKMIKGGVCSPLGFKASGMHCGIRKNKSKKDLALIYSDSICNTACVYTKNLVKGAPLVVTKDNIKDGKAKAIICNSGNANTCNSNGLEIANEMCFLLSNELKIAKEDVIVASTGVIGQKLDILPIKNAIPTLVKKLQNDSSDAAEAIMTTDTVKKEVAIEFMIDDKVCKIGAIAKGSGMIHPNMATMLVFVTSDVNISSSMLELALKNDVDSTFNMLSVDGDTSTNDMLSIMANGEAGNVIIDKEDGNFDIFMKALNTLTVHLCKVIAGDGEGATKLIECKVSGALDLENAKIAAKSVICSSLVKTAIFGCDANWGRILCALGYSGAKINVNKIDVYFSANNSSIQVCKNGSGLDFSEEKATEILKEKEILIDIILKDGTAEASAWGCDLTYDYVKINGDYRT